MATMISPSSLKGSRRIHDPLLSSSDWFGGDVATTSSIHDNDKNNNNNNTSSSWSSKKKPTTRSHNPQTFFRRTGHCYKTAICSSDALSTTTASTLDDSTVHSQKGSVMVRHLPTDRRLLPEASPQKCLIEDCGCDIYRKFEDFSVVTERSMGPIDVDFVGSDENDCATYAGPVDVDDTDSISSGSSAASSAKESVTSSTIDLASVISGDRSEDQTTRSSSTKASLIVARKNSTEIEVKDAHDTSEMEECLKLIDEVVDSLHSRNQVAAPDTSFIHVGPVDIDDFIPEDSYWSYFHEIVLDESSYCRGLAGYEEGFEPETITDLSQIKDWGDQVGDDDDELDESAIKDYTKPSTSAATANSKSAASPRQRRQLRYQSYPSSLPHTAAEV